MYLSKFSPYHLALVQVSAPYLRSEYGKDYDYDSPVKLLDLLLHGKCKRVDQQVVVLGHVLAADCTIGYEDLQNYQAGLLCCSLCLMLHQIDFIL